MRILGVDPSINRVGLAIVDDGKIEMLELLDVVKEYKRLRKKSRKSLTIEEKMSVIYGYFSEIDYSRLDIVAIERPQSYLRKTSHGETANTKSIEKLRLSIDAMVPSITQNNVIVRFVRPTDWKRNNPKLDIHRRLAWSYRLKSEIKKSSVSVWWGEQKIDHNTLDALGVADYIAHNLPIIKAKEMLVGEE